MADETKLEQTEVVEIVEKKHVEAEAADTDHGNGESSNKSRFGGMMMPVIFLLFMIFAMVVILVVTNMRKTDRTGGNGIQMDDPAVAALKADLEARRSELNRQRMAAGLPPLEGGSEPMEEIAKRLKTDADTLVALSGRFQQILTEKDAQITKVNQDLLRAEQIRQSLSAELSRVQSDFQKALVSGSEADGLKRLLAESNAQRDALASELAAARDQLANMKGAISEEDYADLERRLEEALRARDFFENRAKELEAQAGSAELFASSENELLPAAVELFRRLRKLEGLPDSELTSEYSKLGVELGANVLSTLPFATGSSALTESDKQSISSLVDSVPDGDLLLIIGYASKTGNPEANERLSSDRATAAAEYYSGLKRPGQLVQAVYLGQTDRFSSSIPERNQLCEIWKIRRK